ncbi:MAG: 3-methyl-2-oxobutanoate hydroxymethyltransferase [Rhodospirillales bacterium]|jgi:3-methyl-2-oxobutanoate hydroxymethyltransferase|nr:3-methyl-2-oxobutanoate hydroxymethyltransferase [Rhodospirillales bacterium]
MSVVSDTSKRITIPDIRKSKGKEPIVCLTAYTVLTARWLDDHTDLLLVGDSLGMVIYGMENTLSVTLDMMIAHAQAVMRGSKRSCVIVDMPFGSYEESPKKAFRNAARVLSESGASGIKIEGGVEMAKTIDYITKRGIPVMGHVGLMPQSVQATGGFKAQGGGEGEAQRILQDAHAVEEAGAFAMVIEGTMEPVARKVTESVSIPTIGIGASAACDGQILVTEDLVGLFTDFTPKFVKRYAMLGEQIEACGKAYAADVRAGTFPGPEHLFGMKKTD